MISDQGIWQLYLKPGVGHHLAVTGWMTSSRVGFEKKDNTTKLRVWFNQSSEGLEIIVTSIELDCLSKY